MPSQNIDPIEALDYSLGQLEENKSFLNSVTDKFFKIRNRMVSYYTNNYDIMPPSVIVCLKEDTIEYSYFMFDIGMLTGTISYYKKHNSLTKDHIEDLNKIYKKYK